jgi:hypothetical protein
VEGSPLGIELLARLAARLGLEEACDQVQADPIVLATSGLAAHRFASLADAAGSGLGTLSPGQRRLLAWACERRGGFAVADAEAAGLALAGEGLVDALQRLVDASFVVIDLEGPAAQRHRVPALTAAGLRAIRGP